MNTDQIQNEHYQRVARLAGINTRIKRYRAQGAALPEELVTEAAIARADLQASTNLLDQLRGCDVQGCTSAAIQDEVSGADASGS